MTNTPHWTAQAVEHELQLINLQKHAARDVARLQEENLKLLAHIRENRQEMEQLRERNRELEAALAKWEAMTTVEEFKFASVAAAMQRISDKERQEELSRVNLY